MKPGLPRFSRSSASVYYTERKPKNKKRGRPGNEATIVQVYQVPMKVIIVIITVITIVKRGICALANNVLGVSTYSITDE